MRLHVDSYGGVGAPLLFIPGWGMHGGMWGGVLDQLAQHYRVMSVDLPGQGFSRRVGTPLCPRELNKACVGKNLAHPILAALVDQLSAQFPEPLTLCAWSLGGQLALYWAMRYPQQVQRVVLIATTPCFVQKTDWQCAMSAGTLATFSDALQQDYASTLRRFLALQVRGSEHERELLLTLRRQLLSRGEPDPAALKIGLAILRDCDLREALLRIKQPVLVIAGARDTLTPMAASQSMVTQLPNGRLAIIEGAAHAPFLSHPDQFLAYVVDFLHE
ncbi:MAG: pimeloyl-ACP methyl ester esterase BioH [Gallionella sp.]